MRSREILKSCSPGCDRFSLHRHNIPSFPRVCYRGFNRRPHTHKLTIRSPRIRKRFQKLAKCPSLLSSSSRRQEGFPKGDISHGGLATKGSGSHQQYILNSWKGSYSQLDTAGQSQLSNLSPQPASIGWSSSSNSEWTDKVTESAAGSVLLLDHSCLDLSDPLLIVQPGLESPVDPMNDNLVLVDPELAALGPAESLSSHGTLSPHSRCTLRSMSGEARLLEAADSQITSDESPEKGEWDLVSPIFSSFESKFFSHRRTLGDLVGIIRGWEEAPPVEIIRQSSQDTTPHFGTGSADSTARTSPSSSQWKRPAIVPPVSGVCLAQALVSPRRSLDNRLTECRFESSPRRKTISAAALVSPARLRAMHKANATSSDNRSPRLSFRQFKQRNLKDAHSAEVSAWQPHFRECICFRFISFSNNTLSFGNFLSSSARNPVA